MDQDSLVNKVNITSGEQLNLPKPELQAIPETRRDSIPKPRFVKKVVVHNYLPTPEDSLLFNLIGTEENHSSPVGNNLAKDFLYPIQLSDKEWIGHYTAVERDSVSSMVFSSESEENTKLPETDSPKQDSITSANVVLRDSLVTVSKQDTIPYKSQDALGNADSLQTTIQAKEHKDKFSNHFISGTQKDVISGLLIFSVAIVGFLRMANFKYLRELFSAVIFSQDARKMQKGVNLRNQMHSYVLNGLYLFNTSIFIYEILLYYKVKSIFEDDLWFIPVLMGGILVYDLLKIILYKFIAFVFEVEEQSKEYIYYSQLYSKIFGLVILPLVLVIPYIDIEVVPVLIKIGVGIFILLYLMQIFRGLTIILKDLYSLFYMFLYLCALEILPLIVVFKIIIN